MAGMTGRSGGRRKGAGRKPNPKPMADVGPTEFPLEFLTNVMNDPSQDVRVRVRAAVAAAQYVHPKVGDAGKKDDRQRAAKDVAQSGKFSTPTAPKLVSSR
jgi:phage terminase small subunit